MDNPLEIGNYLLSRFDDESVWIETVEGEGGAFPTALLEDVIHRFYEEHF